MLETSLAVRSFCAPTFFRIFLLFSFPPLPFFFNSTPSSFLLFFRNNHNPPATVAIILPLDSGEKKKRRIFQQPPSNCVLQYPWSRYREWQDRGQLCPAIYNPVNRTMPSPWCSGSKRTAANLSTGKPSSLFTMDIIQNPPCPPLLSRYIHRRDIPRLLYPIISSS